MTEIFNKDFLKYTRKILRRQMPIPEHLLWDKLKNKKLDGHKFRRQFSIGLYIVDFYCPKKKLAIELDGDSHFTKEAIQHDKYRQKMIEALDIKVIRFTNTEIYKNLDKVVEEIKRQLT